MSIWAGYLSRYSDWLWAGRSGDRIPVGARFPPVQTGPVVHPASGKMGTGSFPWVKCGRGVLLNTHTGLWRINLPLPLAFTFVLYKYRTLLESANLIPFIVQHILLLDADWPVYLLIIQTLIISENFVMLSYIAIPGRERVRSKKWIWGRSLAWSTGSNPAGGKDVSLVSVVCFQIAISSSGWSLYQRSPVECGVSGWDRVVSVMRGVLAHWGAFEPWGEKINLQTLWIFRISDNYFSLL
jgi:hypothetical protein